jgi:hypothetical protein
METTNVSWVPFDFFLKYFTFPICIASNLETSTFWDP